MKKLLIALIGIATCVTMAGSHGGGGNCGGGRGCGAPSQSCRPCDRGHRPPPCRPHHGNCDRRDHGCGGVRLAADIVDLVGASLNVLAPRTIVTTPVVTTPVVTTPVVTTPVVTTPVVATSVVTTPVVTWREY